MLAENNRCGLARMAINYSSPHIFDHVCQKTVLCQKPVNYSESNGSYYLYYISRYISYINITCKNICEIWFIRNKEIYMCDKLAAIKKKETAEQISYFIC